MTELPPAFLHVENVPTITVPARRVRRTRKYGGWRARLAGWLRAMAEFVNPLSNREEDRG